MPCRKSSKKGDDLPNNPRPSKRVTRHSSRIGLEDTSSASSTTAAASSASTARAASLATTASTSNIHEDDDEDDNNAASFAMAASASNIREEDDEDNDNDSVPLARIVEYTEFVRSLFLHAEENVADIMNFINDDSNFDGPEDEERVTVNNR